MCKRNSDRSLCVANILVTNFCVPEISSVRICGYVYGYENALLSENRLCNRPAAVKKIAFYTYCVKFIHQFVVVLFCNAKKMKFEFLNFFRL